MKKFTYFSLLSSALLAASPGAVLAAEQHTPTAGAPLTREDAVLVHITATVEAIDIPKREVTVKGPMGHLVTARVANPENLTKMRIGENIVVTYTEALAISLEKASKKSSE